MMAMVNFTSRPPFGEHACATSPPHHFDEHVPLASDDVLRIAVVAFGSRVVVVAVAVVEGLSLNSPLSLLSLPRAAPSRSGS